MDPIICAVVLTLDLESSSGLLGGLAVTITLRLPAVVV